MVSSSITAILCIDDTTVVIRIGDEASLPGDAHNTLFGEVFESARERFTHSPSGSCAEVFEWHRTDRD